MTVRKPKALNFFRITFLYFFFANILFTGTAGAQQLDKIIAKVDNEILLKSELDVAYIQYLSQQQNMAAMSESQTKCTLLETLLINKLLLAKAEIDSVTVEPEQVSEQLESRMDYFIKMAGSEEKLIQTYKKTIDQLKDDLRRSLKEQLIVQKMQGQITGEIKVTPSEVKKFFSEIPRDSLPYFSTSVEVGEIVKKPETGKAEKAEVKALLEEIKAKIKAGEDFCKYAERYSEDPGSKQFCGELGFFKRGELVPEYEAAALKLKPGELSDVILSEYGYHVIQLIERRSNEFNTRHILIKPKSSYKDIDNAYNFLDSIRTVILADSISFATAANKYSENKKTQATGGYFTDQGGSYRISVEGIDPVLFFTLDTMQVGEITHPIKFKLEDGTEAMRIIYLKSKLAPHQANLKDDYQEIYNAAVDHKKNTALNEWFDKTKGEVFIQIDEAYSDCNILVNP